MTTLYEKIEMAEAMVKQRQRRYLTVHGWKSTCTTPCSYWLWQRTMEDGRTLVVDTDTAVRMTVSSIDPEPYSPTDDFEEME